MLYGKKFDFFHKLVDESLENFFGTAHFIIRSKNKSKFKSKTKRKRQTKNLWPLRFLLRKHKFLLIPVYKHLFSKDCKYPTVDTRLVRRIKFKDKLLKFKKDGKK